jgi:hypothetical protein
MHVGDVGGTISLRRPANKFGSHELAALVSAQPQEDPRAACTGVGFQFDFGLLGFRLDKGGDGGNCPKVFRGGGAGIPACPVLKAAQLFCETASLGQWGLRAKPADGQFRGAQERGAGTGRTGCSCIMRTGG